MATFFCTNCGERMCNSSNDNLFENYLIKTNVDYLEEKKYNKIVERVNKEYEEKRKDPEFGVDYKDVDTWFDICFELGQDAWICPKCKTMHVFKRDSNELESVYKIDNSWKDKVKDNREKSCGCIILKDNKALLVGARDDNGELFWSFPKGHQEDGETDMETASRETKEETNLDVKIIDNEPIKTGHLVHGGIAYKEILLFIAEPLNNEIKMQEDEVEKVKWVKIDEAGKYFDGYYSDAWGELLNRLNN